MTSGRILVTGGSGFVGRQVVRVLMSTPGAPPLRVLQHRRPLDPEVTRKAELVTGNLARPATLDGCCTGVTTLVHLAADLSDDAERCTLVNGAGTEALMEQARGAGVRRIIGLSSAAVYGYAVHRNAGETDVRVAPATPISRSRVRAEQAVLEAGGIILRPLFVYGEGDTRFLPGIMAGLQRLPFLLGSGRARLSVVAVEDLAVVIARLALGAAVPPGVYHVTDGNPVTFRAIADTLRAGLGIPVPRWSLPYPLGRWVVRAGRGGLLGAPHWGASDDHRLFLVTHDHYYSDAQLRRHLTFPEGPSLVDRLPCHLAWYAQFT